MHTDSKQSKVIFLLCKARNILHDGFELIYVKEKGQKSCSRHPVWRGVGARSRGPSSKSSCALRQPGLILALDCSR